MSAVTKLEDVRTSEYQIDPSWKNERQILCQLINEGATRKEIADVTGLNRKYISQYSNGKCLESIEKVEESLRNHFKSIGRWTEQPEQSAQKEGKPSGYITRAEQIGIISGINDIYKAKAICDLSYSKREFNLIYGRPGTGKTIAIREFAKAHPGTYVVTCSRSTKSKTLFMKIADALGIISYGSTDMLSMRIAREIKRKASPTLIIIDEADLLKINALEDLRALYDEVNATDELNAKERKLGIVLCGNEKLVEDIAIYAAEREDYKRLQDRIGHYQKMKGLGELEAEKFLDRINCTKDAKKMLIDIGVSRGIRQLVMALGRLLDYTEGKLITAALVEEIGQIVLSFA